MSKPLVNGSFLLQKFSGKGGWTYCALPSVSKDTSNPFGWRTVKGTIDDYALAHYKLMPMGDGQLFLPVKAEIRKKIGKEAGDFVHVVLSDDRSPLTIPKEIMECFQQEPEELLQTFMGFSQGEQKAYINWIYNTKSDDKKAERIVLMMERLSRKLKFHDAG